MENNERVSSIYIKILLYLKIRDYRIDFKQWSYYIKNAGDVLSCWCGTVLGKRLKHLVWVHLEKIRYIQYTARFERTLVKQLVKLLPKPDTSTT